MLQYPKIQISNLTKLKKLWLHCSSPEYINCHTSNFIKHNMQFMLLAVSCINQQQTEWEIPSMNLFFETHLYMFIVEQSHTTLLRICVRFQYKGSTYGATRVAPDSSSTKRRKFKELTRIKTLRTRHPYRLINKIRENNYYDNNEIVGSKFSLLEDTMEEESN